MRKKRVFTDGSFYHVTSRTNDKIRVFENKLGRKIMLIVLMEAKDKYRFRLANFCIMPTHIHLLIEPPKETNLSVIMQWIKTRSASRWNKIHGSIDHMWGHRYFSRAVKDSREFDFVMNYIDQNPVKAGISSTPEEYHASGAFYKARNISGMVDSALTEETEIKLLSPIPPLVSRFLPPAQLSYTIQNFGAYVSDIDRLYKTIQDIPKIGDTNYTCNPIFYIHYTTGTADYFICEYDGQDSLFGKVRFSVYPAETTFQNLSLEELKKNPHLKLDFGWGSGIKSPNQRC